MIFSKKLLLCLMMQTVLYTSLHQTEWVEASVLFSAVAMTLLPMHILPNLIVYNPISLRVLITVLVPFSPVPLATSLACLLYGISILRPTMEPEDKPYSLLIVLLCWREQQYKHIQFLVLCAKAHSPVKGLSARPLG